MDYENRRKPYNADRLPTLLVASALKARKRERVAKNLLGGPETETMFSLVRAILRGIP